jgi:hypothetical protein
MGSIYKAGVVLYCGIIRVRVHSMDSGCLIAIALYIYRRHCTSLLQNTIQRVGETSIKNSLSISLLICSYILFDGH